MSEKRLSGSTQLLGIPVEVTPVVHDDVFDGIDEDLCYAGKIRGIIRSVAPDFFIVEVRYAYHNRYYGGPEIEWVWKKVAEPRLLRINHQAMKVVPLSYATDYEIGDSELDSILRRTLDDVKWKNKKASPVLIMVANEQMPNGKNGYFPSLEYADGTYESFFKDIGWAHDLPAPEGAEHELIEDPNQVRAWAEAYLKTWGYTFEHFKVTRD